MAKISGHIQLPAGTAGFRDARIRIRLEDISLMDAPAQILAQKVLKPVQYSGQAIAFAFEADDPAGPVRYNLSVHISLSGVEEIRKGDYITKQVIPVLPPSDVEVPVEQV